MSIAIYAVTQCLYQGIQHTIAHSVGHWSAANVAHLPECMIGKLKKRGVAPDVFVKDKTVRVLPDQHNDHHPFDVYSAR